MIEKVKRQGHFLVPGRWGGWLRLEVATQARRNRIELISSI
jgi:hypothetical protein